jgi:hypothetical protein
MKNGCDCNTSHFCAWKLHPSEYVSAKLFPEAWQYFYHKRIHERFIEEGYRRGDGTWEGEKLEGIPLKEYKEMLKDFGKEEG